MWPLDVLHDPAWRPLTWTLLHFSGKAGRRDGMAPLFRLTRARSTQFRYLLGIAGMFLMAACPVATFIFLESTSAPFQEVSSIFADARIGTVYRSADIREATEDRQVLGVSLDTSSWNVDPAQWIGDAQPYLLCGWIVGLLCFSGRLLLGAVGRPAAGARSAGHAGRTWADRTWAIAARMGFAAMPRVFSSKAAREAVVTGLLRPMVLLPVAWLAEMSPEVLEAVIAHELAHIRRFDCGSTCSSVLSRRCCFIILPCGGCRVACGWPARCVATSWRPVRRASAWCMQLHWSLRLESD